MANTRQWQDETDELDRAISEASGPTSPSGASWRLDPALAETIRAVASNHRGPAPSGVFAARLASQFGVPVLPAPAPASQRGTKSRTLLATSAAHVLPTLPRAIGHALSYVSLMSIVLVMLGGIWLTAQDPDNNRGATTANIPASVSGGFPNVPCCWTALLIRRITLAPGVSFNDIGFRLAFVVVESGSVTFRGSAHEPDQLLGPGDTAPTPHGVAILQNVDPDHPATLLDVGFYTQDSITGTNPRFPGVTFNQVASNTVAFSMTGNETATLRRVRVGAGHRTQSWQTTGTSWVFVQQGQLALTVNEERRSSPSSNRLVRVVPGWVAEIPPNVEVAARGQGDDPVVFFVVNIVSPPSPSPTPMT